MNFEWWTWIVGGLALIVAELAIPSFFIVWFGLGAPEGDQKRGS